MKMKFALLLSGLFLASGALAQQFDWGDAPSPYPTVSTQNGARHVVPAAAPGTRMGALKDTENDGQPNATATGDDIGGTGGDDEDGVNFLTALVPGSPATVQVLVSGSTVLNAWIDFNADGDWADPGEQVFTNRALGTGTNNLNFNVPAAAKIGPTFSRFRVSDQSGLSFVGQAPDGEVEDHQVTIGVVDTDDFGDAPTNNYPTMLFQNGARHSADPSFCLGTKIDVESDGQPTTTANGDDVNPSSSDDEDGVTFLSPISAGSAASIQVFLTAPVGQTALLNAWMDFNRDGDWADPGEQIFTNRALTPGNNNLSFNVPAAASAGTSFARFRLSRQGGISFFGFAQDGEVEDYQVTLGGQLDFGDAPTNSYPTMLADNGARHTIVQGFYLGSRVDAEPDGQPNANATGDDLNGPDEDGVVGAGPLITGQPYTVQVTASQTGFLNAWVDFNGDGDWADPGEQIATAKVMAPGVNPVNFNVPANAKSGTTFARFRYSHVASLSFETPVTGAPPDGEVEDYQVQIINDRERCDLDCEGRDFWLTFPGNYAPDTNNPVRASVCIGGTPGVVGTVTIAGLGFSANYTIPASGAAFVLLPSAADLGNANDTITNKGIHVTASSDVHVTAFNQVHYTSDSYLALHTPMLGTEYIVLGFGNEHTNVPPLNGSQFAIVATESNTLVTVTPSVATLGHPSGVPFNLVLQPGDCYQLRNTNNTPADLAGTIVTSDKPIGVFGSHQCANIPSSNTWFCDYIVEQLLPVNTWGNDFYTAPLATRTGDTFRILASQNGTTVSLNGAAIAALNRGQFREIVITNGSHITATKPVFVAQYANSSDFDGVVNADPFMLTVQATKHYVNDYRVCTPTNDFAVNFIHIIAPTSTVATVQVDGAGIGAFTPITGTSYAYRRQSVAQGSHTVTAGAPISVSVYGWAEYESYGHPGCFFVGDVLPPTVTPPTTNVTTTVGGPNNPNPCGAFVPDVSRDAQVSDNCSPAGQIPTTQVPTAGTVVGPGVHTIQVFAQDSSGNVGHADVTFNVIDPSTLTINCPSNIVVNCTSSNGAIVNYQVSAQTACNPNVPVFTSVPSGSVFPPCTTFVTCTASNNGQTASCVFAVTVKCADKLSIVPAAGGNVTMTWGCTGVLERASNVIGPWFEVTNGVNRFTAPANGNNRYFRVRY